MVPGIIPTDTTYEQKSKFGIYPERLSGSAFMLDRKSQKQAFLYRTLPSTLHGDYTRVPNHPLDLPAYEIKPVNSAWAAVDIDESADFLNGIRHIAGAGDPNLKNGIVIYTYTAGKSMPKDQAFDNADGDWCISKLSHKTWSNVPGRLSTSRPIDHPSLQWLLEIKNADLG